MQDLKQTAALLRQWDKILVLSHASPDGDTLGSACALIRGLRAMGKRAEFRCADEIGKKFAYLFRGLAFDESAWTDESFHVMTVDVADISLLGKIRDEYKDRIELAIDHHGTHRAFAPVRWIEADSAATAEMIWLLLKELGVTPDAAMADDVYTGVSTDTGCMRYRNATPRTHRIAAEAMEAGADAGEINRVMFECKSRAQIEAERTVMSGIEFFCGGRCSMIKVPAEIYEKTGVSESELEGLASLPRQIEGVLLGITMKERKDGTVKASVRANDPANAIEICAGFGGGGHTGAAGCSFPGLTLEEAAEKIKEACEAYISRIEGQL